MTVQRHGPTPTFLEYILDHPLIPTAGPPNIDLPSMLSSEARWTEIPTYQRGIEWEVDNIEEMLISNSILLGTCILGDFEAQPGQYPHLPTGVTRYAVLVDGLQRLSVGTCLLSVLYPLVICAEPQKPEYAALFRRLVVKVRACAEIFLHNDQQLANHPRQAVKDAYLSLKGMVAKYIAEKLTPAEATGLSEQIVRLFMDRQVAVDLYFNFVSATELANTFIGINTVRVDLAPVDLLRSAIVERAIRSGWRSAVVEDMENRFTDLFTEEGVGIKELEPFVLVALKELAERGRTGTNVFPSWGGSLAQSEVDDLLDFVDRIFVTSKNNAFIQEIRASANGIPLAGILCHYYRNYLATHNLPSFVTGGSSENAQLHKFLCATYRAVLAGKINRTTDIPDRLLTGIQASLDDAANEISRRFTGRDVSAPLDRDWLLSALRASDRKRAPRVFNAARLPEQNRGWGSPYAPDSYGTASKDYHVDHLIPKSVINSTAAGARDADMLVNLAPLPSTLNREAKNTPCSEKLRASGMYDNYLRSNPSPHPYCQWLVGAQGGLASDLDRQELLEWNQTQRIPDDRIGWLADYLLPRI